MELKDDVNKWIVCRICLQKPSSGLESIFYQNDDQDLTLMIFECGGVPIIKFDHYPDKICTKCLEHLKVAHMFRKTCQQSHKKLSRLIEADVSIKKQRIISVEDEDGIGELEPKFDPKDAKTGIETEMVLGLSNVFDHEAEEFTAEDKKITKIATAEVAKSAVSSTADHEEENAVTMLFEFSVKQEEEFFEKEVISDVYGAFVEEADRLNQEDASRKSTGIYYKNLELKVEPHDNEKINVNEISFDNSFEDEDDKLMDKHEHFQKAEVIQNPIYELLLQSGDGRSIIKYYIENGELSKKIRNLLSRLIVNAEKERQLAEVHSPYLEFPINFKISRETFVEWSLNVEKLFPGELHHVYYSPYKSIIEEEKQLDGSAVVRKRKINCSGVLVEHYSYLFKTKQHLLKNVKDKKIKRPKFAKIISEEAQCAVKWLSTNLSPPDAVIRQWKTAYEARRTKLDKGCSICTYFEAFPVLKESLGPKLLALDFDKLFPHRQCQFFDRWDTARNILITALRSCKELRGEDQGYYNALPSLAEEGQNSVLLYLLPYLIKHSRNAPGSKVSIKEQQEALFIHAQTASDIQKSVNRLSEVCTVVKQTLPPIPVIVGPLVNPVSFYVYVNDSVNNPTIYKVPSLLKAIDLTFKIFVAVNCTCMKRSDPLWTFIRKAFYNINLNTDKCTRETSILIGKITNNTN